MDDLIVGNFVMREVTGNGMDDLIIDNLVMHEVTVECMIWWLITW